eukprot:3932847-Rhodomonas_salina.3
MRKPHQWMRDGHRWAHTGSDHLHPAVAQPVATDVEISQALAPAQLFDQPPSWQFLVEAAGQSISVLDISKDDDPAHDCTGHRAGSTQPVPLRLRSTPPGSGTSQISTGLRGGWYLVPAYSQLLDTPRQSAIGYVSAGHRIELAYRYTMSVPDTEKASVGRYRAARAICSVPYHRMLRQYRTSRGSHIA